MFYATGFGGLLLHSDLYHRLRRNHAGGGKTSAFKDAAGALIGGNNMAAKYLADAVGGNLFLGFISAVAFATILAVAAGLTLARRVCGIA